MRTLKPRCSGRRWRRHGTSLVEMAIIAPVTFLLLLGLCVAGLGVFRYHQLTALTLESARWASVHGKEYSKATGKHVATKQDIYDKVIKPRAAGLDLDKLEYDVTWDEKYASVAVTLTYHWIPEAFFAPISFVNKAEVLSTY